MSQVQYPFLSEEWMDEAAALRDAYADQAPQAPVSVRFNINIKNSPHHPDGPIEGHIDSSTGEILIDRGHIDEPELTITIEYGTAKAAFVSQNAQAVMEAFFTGKILVEGDASKLPILLAQRMDPTPEAREMFTKIQAFTSDD